MTQTSEAVVTQPQISYRLSGSSTAGLVMGTWGFFVGFAAVALYGRLPNISRSKCISAVLRSGCLLQRRN